MILCRSFRVWAGPNTPVTEPWWTKNNPDNMRSVSSVEEYVQLLVPNLVIFVYASGHPEA